MGSQVDCTQKDTITLSQTSWTFWERVWSNVTVHKVFWFITRYVVGLDQAMVHSLRNLSSKPTRSYQFKAISYTQAMAPSTLHLMLLNPIMPSLRSRRSWTIQILYLLTPIKDFGICWLMSDPITIQDIVTIIRSYPIQSHIIWRVLCIGIAETHSIITETSLCLIRESTLSYPHIHFVTHAKEADL